MLGVPVYVVAAAALVVMSVPLFVWSLAGERRRIHDPDLFAPQGDRRAHLETSPFDRVFIPVARVIGRQARRITPVGWIDALDRRIKLAGSPPQWTVERALALKLVLGAAGAFGVWILIGDVGVVPIAATALGGFVGYVLVDAILYGRGRERQNLVLRQLPDTLDQLTISVEAGLGFDAALQRIADAGSGPLADELGRVLAEVKVGIPRAEAMRSLLGRTDVPELRHFVMALRQAEQFGMPIARVLRIQSGELRTKRRQRAEEAALKIPVKIVFPLVLCIFPALFVVLLGPAMIRVARTLL